MALIFLDLINFCFIFLKYIFLIKFILISILIQKIWHFHQKNSKNFLFHFLN
jgi:hypothetical protein